MPHNQGREGRIPPPIKIYSRIVTEGETRNSFVLLSGVPERMLEQCSCDHSMRINARSYKWNDSLVCTLECTARYLTEDNLFHLISRTIVRDISFLFKRIILKPKEYATKLKASI